MSKTKILLVDDDLHYRKSLADYLHIAGFDVDVCQNSIEAISQLRKNGHEYKVVLLDWALKTVNESGQVMEKIKAINPYLPVVVFTGDPREGGAAALQQGASWYLRKPFSVQDLETIIRDLLAQDEIFHQIAGSTKEIMGSDQCLIWRYYEKTQDLKLAGWADSSTIYKKDTATVLKASEPKVRRILRSAFPSFIRSIQDNPSQYHAQDFVKRHKWNSVIAAPMRYKGETIGLLEIYIAEGGELLTGPQARIERRVQAFAEHAAESIYSAEQTGKNQELINSVSSLSAEQPSLDALSETILAKAKDLVEADADAFYIRDFGHDCLSALGYKGQQRTGFPKRISMQDDNLAAIAAREGTIELIESIETSDKLKPLVSEIFRSQVAIPLKHGELIVGVLALTSKSQKAFSEGDVALMRSFASLVGPALDQAKLQFHLQQISQAALKGYEILQNTVIRAIHELLGKSVALWLWNDKKTEFIVPVALGVSENFKKKAHIGYVGEDDSLIAHAFLTKQPVNCDDLENPGYLPVKLDGLLRQENWRSTLIVPIFDSEEQPIGAIAIKRDIVGQFSQYEVDFLSNFASQVAIAFENHWRRRRLEQLIKSGQIVIEQVKGEKNVLDQFAKMACDLTGAPCAVIYPYDPEKGASLEIDRVAANGLIKPNQFGKASREKGLSKIISYTHQLVVHNLDKGEINADNLEQIPRQLPPLSQKNLLEILRQSNFIHREGVKAFIGISLRASGIERGDDARDVVGVLYVNYRTPHHFTESEISIIQLFAQQAANLIRASRLWDRQEEQLKISQTLVDASDQLAKAKDRDDVLRIVFQSAFAFVGKVSGLALSMDRNHRLRIVDSKGLTRKQIADFHNQPAHDTGSFAEVVRTGRVFETDDTSKSLTDGRMVDYGLRIPTQVTNLPVFSSDRVSGILVLDTYVVSPKVRDALFALTDMAGTALDKVDAHEEQGRQLDALKEIAGVIGSSANPLAIVLEQAVKLFNADYGNIGLSIPAARELVFNVHWEDGRCLVDDEIPSDKRRSSWDDGITGYVARTGKLRCEADVSKARNYMMWYPDSKSELAVPLIGSKGNTIGVLDLESKTLGSFGEVETELCQRLAAMAVVAIEKSELLATTERLNKQLEVLHNVVQEKDMNKALEQVALGVNKIMGPEICSCSITLFDEKANRFTSTIVAVGPLKDMLIIPPRKEGMGWYALGKSESLFIEDAKHIPPGFPRLNPDLIKAGIRSTVALPLIRHEHKLGILFIHQQQPAFFSHELRNLLETYAHQAATAIENARQYEQRGQDIAALQEANEQLKVLHSVVQEKDLKINLRQIVIGINKIMGADRCTCSITLFDEKEDSFTKTIEAAGPLAEKMQIAPREKGKEGIGWGRYVLDHEKPLFVEDVNHLPTGAPNVNPGLLKEGIRSSVALPLIRNKHKWGTLFIHQQQPAVFSPERKRLLETYAHQAAIAIENARQYEQRSKDIAALQNINEAVISRNLDDVLNLIVKQAVEVMPAEYGSLWMGDPHTGDLILEVPPYCPSGEINPPPERLKSDAPSVNMRVYQTGKHIKLDDISREKKGYHCIYKPARSELAVPMKYQGQTIGTLNVESRFLTAFSDENASLLESFAGQAAIAIESARIVSRLKVTNEVSQGLLNRLWQDEESIFRLITNKFGNLMDTSNFFIAFYQERSGEVSFPFAFVDGQRINTTAPETPWKPRRGGKGLTEEVIFQKRWILMRTKEEQINWYKERGENYVNINFASWLGVPLLYGERVLGVVATYHKTKEYLYGEDDAQILSVLAGSLANALKNTREVATLQTLSTDLLKLTTSFWEQEPSTPNGRDA